MARIEVFRKALKACQTLKEDEPNIEVLDSIIPQLIYLIELEEGKRDDYDRLKDIVIGVQASRELQPGYEDLVELLFEASSQARNIKQSETSN